jgi:hypothetical protein
MRTRDREAQERTRSKDDGGVVNDGKERTKAHSRHFVEANLYHHHDQISWTESFLELEFIGPGASTMNTLCILSVLIIAVIAVNLPHRPHRVRRVKSVHVRF